MAQLSDRAYTDRPTIYSQRTGARVIIEENSKAVMVGFRGTKDIKDWLEDAKFWQTHTWGGMIHAGFRDDCNSIIVPLFVELRKRLGRKQRPVWFAGHSLGGAQAPQAAETFFRQQVGELGGVYTFGQPRTWDVIGANSYNRLLGDKTIRVVNEFDIVPHIPPAGLLLRYWHHWSEVMLKDNGGVVEGRSLARKLACDGLMMWHACRVLMNLDLWKDVKEYHSIEMYIGKLESLRR